MSSFDGAFNFVLPREGGFVDNAKDPGGATNYGISLRFLKNLSEEKLKKYSFFKDAVKLDVNDIQHLTLDQAKLIYFGEFWNENGFEKISNQQLTNYIFDMAVNMGVGTTVKLVQRMLCAYFLNKDLIKADGIMGEKTATLINSAHSYSLYIMLVALRVEHYISLVALNPALDQFLDGWINRCYNVISV